MIIIIKMFINLKKIKNVTDFETLIANSCSVAKILNNWLCQVKIWIQLIDICVWIPQRILSANIQILQIPFNTPCIPVRKRKKNVGLKTEHCGTTWDSLKLSERIPSCLILMKLFFKKWEIETNALPPIVKGILKFNNNFILSEFIKGFRQS